MTPIKLSDGSLIDPNQVACAKISPFNTHITVRTKDGIGHVHEPKPGESVDRAMVDLLYRIYGDPRPQPE